MERYYMWVYSTSYGWRQMGSCEGYETIEKLEKDCEFYIMNNETKVLKAKEVN